MSLAGLPGRPHGHRETLLRYCSALPEVGERGPHVLVEFLADATFAPVLVGGVLDPFVVRPRDTAGVRQDVRHDGHVPCSEVPVGLGRRRSVGHLHDRGGPDVVHVVDRDLVLDGGRHQQVELPVRQPLGLRDPVEFARTHLTE